MNFYNQNLLYFYHIFISAAVFIITYFIISKRYILYISAGFFIINILAAIIPMASNAITGDGITESTIYHLIRGGEKISIIFEYKEINYILILLFLLSALLFIFCKKIKIKSQKILTQSSQIFVTILLYIVFFIYSPTISEAKYIYQSSGISYKDSIGLQEIIDQKTEIHNITKKRKNLIIIYAESLEQSFFEPEIFPDLTKNLTTLSKSGTLFNKIHQSPMSNWTIAGMVASQCGMPLSSHLLRNDNAQDFSNFTNNAICLGNLLKHNSYYLSYIGGADTNFAGKNSFYKNQAFDEINGLNEILKPNTEVSKWGLYDEDLFPIILEKIKALRKNNSPFALFALTLDTHPPEGFASNICKTQAYKYSDGKNKHLNAIKCSDIILSRFLEQIITNNIDDSNIILLSDHLMMNSRATDVILKHNIQRFNRMVIWSKDLAPGLITRSGSQFDIASTIWHIHSGQYIPIGFGKSLVGHERTLTEIYESKIFDDSVRAWRVKSWKYW